MYHSIVDFIATFTSTQMKCNDIVLSNMSFDEYNQINALEPVVDHQENTVQ